MFVRPLFLRPLFQWMALLILLVVAIPRAADAATIIALRGHLDKAAIESATKAADTAPDQDDIVLEVSSRTGDLDAALDFAKALYQRRDDRGGKIVVFIDDEALGPSAVFPFLANELVASPFVSWGDIPSGTDSSPPTNLLRSQVNSLIHPDDGNREKLLLLAEAMVDPSLQIVRSGGQWRRASPSDVAGLTVLSPAGETLVVNQNHLRELALVQEVVAVDTFRDRYVDVAAAVDGASTPAAASTDVLSSLEKHIKFDPDGNNTIGYIAVTERNAAISESTWLYVKNALDYYKENKPAMIILELNTPGGQVFSSQKISDALHDIDKLHGIPVVAYIDNWAISAGAMLAYSCRFIATVSDASMGAAEPVFASSGEMQSAPEKVNSALRTDFRNRAAFYGRDTNLAEAMVDKDIILVERFGKVVRLDSSDDIKRTGANRDRVICAEGKLLTLGGKELVDFGVSDIAVEEQRLSVLTEQERTTGKYPASKHQLFQQAFFKEIPNATVDEFRLDWRGRLLALLTSPAAASLLFMGLMLGFYMEINTPGFGIPGSMALICLLLMLLSSFALEAMGWLEVILMLLGLVLIAADIFLIPTFGLLGIAGIAFFAVGIIGLLVPGIESVSYDVDSQTVNAAGEAVLHRLAWLAGAFVVSIGLMVALARYVVPNMAVFNRLVLKGEQDASAGYVAGPTASDLPAVGSKGRAATTLRPAGKVMIDDRLYDGVSGGRFIEKGTPITVSRIDGSHVVVQANSKGENK